MYGGIPVMSATEFQSKLLDRRDIIKGLFAASSLAFLSACTGGSGSADSGSSDGGDASEVFVKTYLTSPSSLDPYCAYASAGAQVTYQLFDSLTRYDFERERIVPLAASSFSASEDGLTFTFKLRRAQFHNGETVTSTSFKRGWERLCATSGSLVDSLGTSSARFLLASIQGYDDLLQGRASGLAGVQCPDDQTLVVTCSEPCADLPYIVAHPALAPIPQAAETDADSFAARPVGNGPFSIKRTWKQGDDVDLVRFDGYYGSESSVDGISFIDGDNTETIYKQFLSGRLDFCEVPIEEVSSAVSKRGQAESSFEMSEGNHLVKMPELKVVYLALNLKNEWLANADVRKGISLALNREGICKDIYRGVCLPADDIVPPTCPGYREGAWDCTATDVDRAASLVKGAKADSDAGDKIKLTFGYVAAGGNAEVAKAIAEALDKVGFDIELKELKSGELLRSVKAGEVDIARLSWGTETPEMGRFMRPLFRSGEDGSANGSLYADDDVDAKLDAARAIVDDSERIAAFQEVDDIVSEACPVIPLMFYVRSFAGSDRIEKLDIDVLGNPDFASASVDGR